MVYTERAMPYEDTMFLKMSVDVLSFFDPEQLRRITPDIERNTYKKGDIVIFKGQITDGFYIIKKGSVLVVMKPKPGQSEPVTVPLATGDFFGEMSLLTGSPRSAHVTALCDTTALELDKLALGPILQANPSLAKRLGDIVLHRQLANDATLRAMPPAERRTAQRSQAAELLANIRAFFALD